MNYLSLLFNWLLTSHAHAADLCDLDPTFVNCKSGIPAGGELFYMMSNLLGRIPYFLGGLALLALIYSGGMYILALGDPARMEIAKKNITWVVIGILAIVGMLAVIGVISWLASPAT